MAQRGANSPSKTSATIRSGISQPSFRRFDTFPILQHLLHFRGKRVKGVNIKVSVIHSSRVTEELDFRPFRHGWCPEEQKWGL